MSQHDDDEIAFDFFDEPETVEATQRRRLPRLERPGGRGGGERPPRPPLRTPTGLVPLARLVGLIAIAIVLVAPGLKESDLETKLEQYAQHEQQAFQQAQQIRPPGPLRAIHQHLIDAI